MDWKLKTGNFLFKYRSFTPIPLIIAVFIFFKPGINPMRETLITLSGLIVMISGETIRIISVGYSFTGTSGRENFLRADNLNVSGIYSIVRNPLYIGNILIYTGLLIVYSNIYALLFFDILLIFQYYFIILAEENFLLTTYGNEYLNYKKKVRSIIPRRETYKVPVNRFNGLKVLFKENDSVFNALVILLIILVYKQSIRAGYFFVSVPAFTFLSFLILCYLWVKIRKKKKS